MESKFSKQQLWKHFLLVRRVKKNTIWQQYKYKKNPAALLDYQQIDARFGSSADVPLNCR